MIRLSSLSPVALAAAVAAVAPGPVGAQVPESAGARAVGTVHGVVQVGPVDPVPYAVVAMPPRFPQRFTDGAGAFVFTRVPAGTYHLQVRQVGYRPVDTSIVVVPGLTTAVTVVIERLTVQLEAITVVTARDACTEPGPPDAGSPELSALFEQLEQYARQYRLLVASYQFRYRMIRTFADLDEVGNLAWMERDTVSYQSSATAHYRPGDVIVTSDQPDGTRRRDVILPNIADLADDGFQTSHCFTYAGRVGQGLVRFHFRPPESQTAPDLEGDVDLDPRTYQIRRASVSLTHADQAQEGMRAAASNITFAELLPNIVVQKQVVSFQELAAPVLQLGGAKRISRYVEDQRLVDVHFLHPLPGAQEPAP